MQNTNRTDNPIKEVFDKLGETLDYEKKALRKMNMDSLLRTNKSEKAGLIVLIASFIIWVVVLLSVRDVLQTLRGQILLLTNMLLICIVMTYKFYIMWKMRRTSIKQSINDTYKRAIGNRVAGKDIIKIKGVNGETLNQVELLFKSDVEEIQARGELFTDALKNVNPFLISLGVLFGIFGIATGRGSVLAIAIALAGTTANLFGLIIKLGLQPEIIRSKQCLAIIEQAKELEKIKTAEEQVKFSEPSAQ